MVPVAILTEVHPSALRLGRGLRKSEPNITIEIDESLLGRGVSLDTCGRAPVIFPGAPATSEASRTVAAEDSMSVAIPAPASAK